MAQVREHWPSKCGTLSSNPSTTLAKKEKRAHLNTEMTLLWK
jgi:hypothetical protein